MSKPTVGDLETQLEDLVRNWESFARQLPGLKESILDEITYNKRDDVKSQKAAMYKKWLKVWPDASWDDVIEGLHTIGENTIAKHIQEWLSSINRQMSLSPQPTLTQGIIDNSSTSTPTQLALPVQVPHQKCVRVEKDTVQELKELHGTFSNLASRMKDETEHKVDNGQVKIKSLVNYIKEQRAFPIESAPTSNTAEGVLDWVRPHYNFLNPYLLVALAVRFLTSDIVKELQCYNDRLTAFAESTPVKSLVETLQQFRDDIPTNDIKIIKIKVKNGFDHRLTIWVVQMLIQTLFPVMHHSELPWYEVGVGSLALSFIATNHMILPLIVSCARKMEFMRHLGIISVTIGNILIRVNDEGAVDDDPFSFENSLIEATAGDNIEAVRFLLKYVQVNVNAFSDVRYLEKFNIVDGIYLTENRIFTQLKRLNDLVKQLKKKASTFPKSTTTDSDDLIEHQFLNTVALKNQLIHLPNSLQKEFTSACEMIEKTKSTAKIGYLQEFLQLFPRPLKYITEITITLNKVWSKCSVERLEFVTRFLFPSAHEEFYWFRVKKSKKILKIKLLITPKYSGQLYFHPALAEVLGAIQVQKNNIVIFKSAGNDSYTFERGIHEATTKGHKQIAEFLSGVKKIPCQLLFKGNFEPDDNNNIQMVPDNRNSTPLMIACCNSNSQIVQLLLEHNADPNIKTKSLNTALFFSSNSSKIFQMLVDGGAYVEFINQDDYTVLHRVCGPVNNLRIVKTLLKRGYPLVNRRGFLGNTALFWACSYGHVEIVDQLLKAKADANIPDNQGATPLWQATFNGHLPIVERLIKAHVNINIFDNGTTPLWAASAKGHKAIVECLLRAQADPHLPDNTWFGMTPLQIACLREHIHVAHVLFNHILAKSSSNEDKLAQIAKVREQLSINDFQYLYQLQAKADPSILKLYYPTGMS